MCMCYYFFFFFFYLWHWCSWIVSYYFFHFSLLNVKVVFFIANFFASFMFVYWWNITSEKHFGKLRLRREKRTSLNFKQVNILLVSVVVAANKISMLVFVSLCILRCVKYNLRGAAVCCRCVIEKFSNYKVKL